MKHRLQRHERDAIRAQFERENILFDFLKTPCKAIERELKTFKFTHEEVFLECIGILDSIKEDAGAFISESDGLADTLFCNFRDLAPEGTPEAEICEAVDTILFVAVQCVCLLTGESHYYNTILNALMRQSSINDGTKAYYSHISAIFHDASKRLPLPDFYKEISDYMKSDMFLSSEVEEMLAELPVTESSTSALVQRGQAEYTIKELVILFETLLNVPLSPSNTNIRQLSMFISKVSGYKHESIRQTIVKGIDYDNREVKVGAEKLISDLRTFCPKIAEQIERNIEE